MCAVFLINSKKIKIKRLYLARKLRVENEVGALTANSKSVGAVAPNAPH